MLDEVVLDNDMSVNAYRVDRPRKRELLKHLMAAHGWSQMLIFVRTKHAAGRLVKQLEANGLNALLAHNSMGKVRRNDALAAYLAEETKILVVSDMALRGLEISSCPGCVFNMDLPANPASAAQREACMQHAEESVCLLAAEEETEFANWLQRLELSCTPVVVEGFEPDPALAEVAKDQEVRPPRQADRQRTTGRHKNNARNGQSRKVSNGNARQTRLDENGDVNGNTLSSDNANRSAIELASEGAALRRNQGRGRGSRQRVDGNR